nr:glutathione S-transferase family protein [Sneathiella aquimaris]
MYGYRFSVYNRIVRLVLHEKEVGYSMNEVNPFTELDASYLKLHPFGRVPVLSHNGFDIFETSAISRYIDSAFDGAPLRPANPQAAARVDQVISIIDNYGYWPMVRQVFSQRVVRKIMGEPTDENEVCVGIEASRKVLSALNNISDEGYILDGSAITLAECHLVPMMDYFTRAPEGLDELSLHPALQLWWDQISRRDSVKLTDPDISKFAS